MRLFDTYTRGLVDLPAPPGPIRMYFCGPTVYQRIHIGNARPFVLSLWLKRWLVQSGYEVTLAENITDINDKIYDAARPQGVPSAELAARASGWYVADTDLLGLGRPDQEPKATESVEEIVELIGKLIDRGLAYAVESDVYFRVAAFPEYGRLSGREGDEDALRNPSEEPERAELKEDPRDFALWKAHKPEEDTWWESPWGRGRPGWHIECSAMAEKWLGPVFELHGGGNDLIFPHHENEIAQSRGAGSEFAKLWMHNGMLQLTGEKMSKSVGNIVSLREAVERWGRATILLFFLSAHWRKPIEFNDDVLEQAEARWRAIVQRLYELPEQQPAASWDRFAEALEDDFNTPGALTVLQEWADRGQFDLLHRGLDIFGLDVVPEPAPDQVRELATDRDRAREAKDFAASDELRDRIDALGWIVQDTADGSTLVPK